MRTMNWHKIARVSLDILPNFTSARTINLKTNIQMAKEMHNFCLKPANWAGSASLLAKSVQKSTLANLSET